LVGLQCSPVPGLVITHVVLLTSKAERHGMAHGTVAEREATTSIPALIKRNTLLLALSQALTGAGMGVPSSIGPLVVVALTGTALGAFLSPVMITAADTISGLLGLDPLGLTWLFIPLVILPGIVCVAWIRPDPRDIALRLDQYYPGYRGNPRGLPDHASQVGVGTFLRDHPLRVAIVASFAAQSN